MRSNLYSRLICIGCSLSGLSVQAQGTLPHQKDSIVIVNQDAKRVYGVRRTDGTIELHEEYTGIFPLHCPGEARYKVRLPEGGLIITDSLFNPLSDKVFEDIHSDACRNDFIQYKVNGKWGIMDGKLKEVTGPVYEKMETLWRDDALIAIKDGIYGMIDRKANILFPFEYEQIHASRYVGGAILFKKKGLVGVMNLQGDTILPFDYTKIMDEPGQYFVTDRAGKKGIFDFFAAEILPVEYDDMEDLTYTGQLVILRKGGKYGLYKGLKIVTPLVYDNLQRQYLEGVGSMFLVTKGKKKGWLNPDGELLNDTLYNEAELFLEGYSRVRKKRKWMEIGVDGAIKGN
jgi:hypothetical protein